MTTLIDGGLDGGGCGRGGETSPKKIILSVNKLEVKLTANDKLMKILLLMVEMVLIAKFLFLLQKIFSGLR